MNSTQRRAFVGMIVYLGGIVTGSIMEHHGVHPLIIFIEVMVTTIFSLVTTFGLIWERFQ